MSNRERLLRAARFEHPDRIPITMGINNACWHHYPQDALQALMAEHPLLFPNFKAQSLPIKPAYAPWRIAGRRHTDSWGCVWETLENGITGTVSRPALPSWEAFECYHPPDPATQNGWGAQDWCQEAARIARARECGDLVQGSLRHGHTFLTLSYIRGYEALLFDMSDEEPRLGVLIEMIETFNTALVQRYVDLGVEWLGFPEDLGMQRGPMLSPQHFRTYIKPPYVRMMALARRAGCVVHMHSDGDIRTLAGDLLDCGVDVINVQDLVNGLDWLAETFAGRVCIDLDLDRQRVTRFGSPDDIDALVLEAVTKLGSREGGLMLRHGLMPGLPLTNIAALMNAMERCATYYGEQGQGPREMGRVTVPTDNGNPVTGNPTRSVVLCIRNELLSTEDTVCLERARLVTEADRRLEDDPPALRRARTFAHVLRTMTLDVETNPFFAGNTSTRPRAWMLVPEYGFKYPPQIIHENPQLDGLLEGQIPQEMLDYWADRSFGGNAGIGHLAVDLDRVVHEGLMAIVTEAERYAGVGTEPEQVTRQAMVITLQAVMDWAGRYAGAADAAGRRATDPLIRAAHLRVANACRRVPSQPARDLFEGLQAIVLVQLALHIEGHGVSVSIGLPDRVLASLVDDSLDLAETVDLVGAFLLKIAANSIFGRGSKTQAITVGGANHAGDDQCNRLTRAFLDACDLVRVGDPHLFLRWHPNGNAEIKRRALEMLASGVSVPLLINDAPTVQGFIEAGVSDIDAWDYCVIGCNELGIPGRSAESATATSGTIQYLGLLNEVLLSHEGPAAIASMGELLELLEVRMAEHALTTRERGQAHRRLVAERMPMPFTSALMHNGVARGRDFMVGMDYHTPSAYERGITNGVNALAAIERVVFEDRVVTMSELAEAMRCNFVGYGALRARLRAAPKWGNGDPRVDAYAPVLLEMRERVLDAVDTRLQSAPHMVCHVVRSLHHFDGKQIAASPDGRLAWTPVADSIGAETGTANTGPTGILNSAVKLNPGHNYRGGTNLNLTLPAAAWQRPEMQANLLSLVETYFAEGGQELQIAALDTATLRDAQAHPERHGDLLVRVAGFNTRFVDLAPVEQAELIGRAEAVG